MKINDVIVEQGVGQELWRRATMRPEQKQELEQMEAMLVKLTNLPLKQVQKNSKDILKQYKKLLNRNDDLGSAPISRELALAKAVKPFYPEVSKRIMDAQAREKIEKELPQQQTAPAAPIKSKVMTSGGVEVVSTRPNIHLRYKKQDFFLKTDPSGVETFVNLGGRKVPDQTQEFLMGQLEQL